MRERERSLAVLCEFTYITFRWAPAISLSHIPKNMSQNASVPREEFVRKLTQLLIILALIFYQPQSSSTRNPKIETTFL